MHTMLIRYFLCQTFFWQGLYAFNIDTHFPIIYSQSPESYFGFSVLFHQNDEGNWLLVGAPRANQSALRNVYQPGIVYKCRNGKCDEILIESSVEMNTSNRVYDMKDDEWLGANLASADGTVVTCAPKWKNQMLYQRWNRNQNPIIYDYYSNGLCYSILKEFAPNTGRRLIPLKEIERQVTKTRIPDFAFGMAGISSHVTEDNVLLLGAPGVFAWEGSLVSIPNLNRHATVVWGPRFETSKHTKHQYFGYSVTSGRFHDYRSSISYVVGSPRYNYNGKVYIITPTKDNYTIDFSWEGEQMGEYFGAAVSATDLNDDGFDDLIIGAPLYAIKKEEGKVYIFINDRSNGFWKPMELYRAEVGATLTFKNSL